MSFPLNAYNRFKPYHSRELNYDFLSNLFGVPVLRLIKLMSTPCHYLLVTEQGEVDLGTSSQVASYHKTNLRLLDTLGVMMIALNQRDWRRYYPAVMLMAEPESFPDANLYQRIHMAIAAWHEASPSSDTPAQDIKHHHLFRHHNDTYIVLADCSTHLRTHDITLNQTELCHALRTLGCRPCHLKIATQTVRAWHIPTKLTVFIENEVAPAPEPVTPHQMDPEKVPLLQEETAPVAPNEHVSNEETQPTTIEENYSPNIPSEQIVNIFPTSPITATQTSDNTYEQHLRPLTIDQKGPYT